MGPAFVQHHTMSTSDAAFSISESDDGSTLTARDLNAISSIYAQKLRLLTGLNKDTDSSLAGVNRGIWSAQESPRDVAGVMPMPHHMYADTNVHGRYVNRNRTAMLTSPFTPGTTCVNPTNPTVLAAELPITSNRWLHIEAIYDLNDSTPGTNGFWNDKLIRATKDMALSTNPRVDHAWKCDPGRLADGDTVENCGLGPALPSVATQTNRLCSCATYPALCSGGTTGVDNWNPYERIRWSTMPDRPRARRHAMAITSATVRVFSGT